MAIHGKSQEYMAIHVNTWQFTAIHGNSHQYMAIHSNTWQYMAIHGNSQQYMITQCTYLQGDLQINNTMPEQV